jgi:hypothetical protein
MPSEHSKRESGYYWVKLGGEFYSNRWEVAEYTAWGNDCPWLVNDCNGGLAEDDIAEVGDRIPRPGEHDQAEQEAEQLGSQPFTSHYWFTEDGTPNGGVLNGPGFTISIQRGVVETTEAGRMAPNGVFTQTLVALVIDVLENLYQKSKFASPYNEEAIACFKLGQDALRRRLRDRRDRGVLNTHNL